MTVPRAWVLVGHYFRVLALTSILGMAASIERGRGLRLDFSFLLLFWIAKGVTEGRKAPRMIAILICAVFVVNAVASLGYTAFAAAPRNSLRWETLFCAIYLLLFLPPLTLLLRPSLLGTPDPPDADPGKPRPPFWSYLVAALLVGALPAGLELSTGRITQQSSTTSFRYGEGKGGMAVLTTAVAEPAIGPSKPLFHSVWVIGETTTAGTSSFLGYSITVGDRTVIHPKVAPLRYLDRLESVSEPADQPNVLIVRADGRVIPLQRRVTFKTLPAAQRAFFECRDFDEIQRKLESLLPEVKGSFPSGLY